jgi:repressor LexA
MPPRSRRPFAHLQRARNNIASPRLTPRQRQVLDWIRGFIESNGMPPTRAEIAAGLGFSTPRLKQIPGMPVQGTLPLVGHVAAGSPILAVENVEAHYRIDPELFVPPADYLLRVRGTSMRDAGILDGDLLAVRKTGEARPGQIVVARVEDEVTVKRFRRRGREIVLEPENPAFEPIVVDPRKSAFAIEGIGVGLVRGGKPW